jgi:hypothetical protein
MNTSSDIDKNKLFNIVKEAIVSSTKKETSISTVRLGTIFQTDYKVIEKCLDQFVDEGNIVRQHHEDSYPKITYRLPE